jgi:rfaE bifunctional protein kinase chain/domain
MVKLTGVFNNIQPKKIMVIGDFLLDTYTIGKARRISPEAPVAVVNVQREERRPGGAGNVALNLISLGAQVVAVGRIGADYAGDIMKSTLLKEGIDIRGICVQKEYPTPVKNRILAENQQIVRVDHEIIVDIDETYEKNLMSSLPSLLEGVDVVAISDYGKGFLSKKVLSELIRLAKKQSIPVIADPKGIDFTKYGGATVLKPNLGEAYAAANMTHDSSLDLVAEKILKLADADYLMITRSEAGISIFHRNGKREDFPVRMREIKDVTGAGDTVLAMLSCAIANELSIKAAVQLSNIAAGIAIEHFGCARVSLSELARRLLEEDVANKIFDDEHFFGLKHVLFGCNFCLLSIDGSQGLTSTIFTSIRKLKQKGTELLIYVRDEMPDPEFVNLLASLHEVDFIMLKSESLRALCEAILPDEVYVVNNGQCHKIDSIDKALIV